MAIVAWVWALFGFALVVADGLLIATEFGDSDAPIPVYLAATAAAICGIGSMVLALHVLGYPRIALWAWRAPAAAYSLVALYVAMKGRSSTLARIGAGLNFVIALLMSAASFAVQRVFAPQSTAQSLPASKTIITIDGVQLWHGVALGILGAGTVLFLVLFIRLIERGVSPQIESNWGGIGGGMGGWRMSASLTYLAGAVVFGLLFAFFILQLKAP